MTEPKPFTEKTRDGKAVPIAFPAVEVTERR